MGCWNNTCGLTNLPIHSGEAVYVFPIMEKDLTGYRSHCYASAFYQPIVTPFEAKYNDYGAGEECTGPFLEVFLKNLKDNMVEHDVGKNQYHDISVKKADMNVDLFFEAVHEDRMQIKHYTGARNVYFTMIRKDVVDALWTDWKFQVYVGKGKGDTPDDYYLNNVTYAKVAASIPAYVADCLAEIKQPTDFPRPDGLTDDEWKTLSRRIARRVTNRGLLMRDDTEHLIGRFLQSLDSSEHFWDLMFIKEIIHEALEADQPQVLEMILNTVLIGIMVNNMMEHVRKIWLPVMHVGSQSQEYPEYRILNSIMENIMTAREAEYEHDEDDGYDDDLFSAKGIYLGKDKAES